MSVSNQKGNESEHLVRKRRWRSAEERREIAEASLEARDYVRDVAEAYRGTSQSDREVASFVSERATWECTGTSDDGGARSRRCEEEERAEGRGRRESSGSHSHRVRASASKH